MHPSLLLAGTGLAQLVLAQPLQGDTFQDIDKRALVTETSYVTVTKYVTVHPSATKKASTTTSKRPSTTSSKKSSATTTPKTTSTTVVKKPSTTTTPKTTSTTVVKKPSTTTSKKPATTSSKASSKTTAKTISSQYSSRSSAAAATTTKSSSVPTISPTASATSGVISKGNLSPQGRKAGLSGFVNIHYYPAFEQLAPYISWYSDYYPNTPDAYNVTGVGMVWGAAGSACTGSYEDSLQAYENMISDGTVPEIMFGFYEPDCYCSSSSQMSVADAATDWNELLAPLSSAGTVLGSPSLCKQYDEDFLTPFSSQIQTSWDVTSIHINKPNLSQVMLDVEYYWNKYQKPVWVSEFACVHDQPNWDPCSDQTEINNFIAAVVPYFENNPHVVAYGASNGEGLGTTWPLIDTQTNNLSKTGQAYLAALQQL